MGDAYKCDVCGTMHEGKGKQEVDLKDEKGNLIARAIVFVEKTDAGVRQRVQGMIGPEAEEKLREALKSALKVAAKTALAAAVK